MKTNYKNVRELTADELDEFRDSYYWQCLDAGIIDVDLFDGVTDEMLFGHYADFSFVDDDFFCNANRAKKILAKNEVRQ